MKALFLKAIKIYQATLRPIFGTQNLCRYSPTCSDYTYDAVKKYGVIKGGVMGIKRILRCHPWARGGFDPVK